MTYRDLWHRASILFDNGKITLGEYEKMTKPLDREVEQESILDNIRAEIEQLHLIGYATIDGKREIASRAVLQIIDKYKAKSEDK